jgi:hypothetical protein
MSCGANIPPEWVNALQSNICPGCGKNIMSPETKEFMDELSSALERMPNDPQGVAGWLLSNYRFQKMGSCEPVERFHRTGAVERSDDGPIKEYSLVAKDNDTAKLIQKSKELASKSPKMAQYANLISSIRDPYEDVEDEEEIDTPAISSDDAKAYEELKAQGLDPFGGAGAASLSPTAVVNSLVAETGGKAEIERLLEQSPEGKRILALEQMRKEKAQDALSGGGMFRR